LGNYPVKGQKNLQELTTADKPILNSISVDAACSGNPGTLEFRGVFTDTETELFRRGPYEMGTVNIGEFFSNYTSPGMAQETQTKISHIF